MHVGHAPRRARRSTVERELGLKDRVDYRVVVEGSPKAVAAAIRNEVYAIGREALVNSLRHSGASRIEVGIRYSAAQLRVCVSDNGTGIDSKMLQSGRAGHWGLFGMRERAERIGAELKIMSRAGSGTEVELYVPGATAFEPRPSSPLLKRLTGLYRRHVTKAGPPAPGGLG